MGIGGNARTDEPENSLLDLGCNEPSASAVYKGMLRVLAGECKIGKFARL